MPQKRNPISSVYITALTSVVRQHAAALLDAMVEDHERATGPWEIEWIVLPEIFCLTAGALAQTRFVLTGLQVDEKRMRANLDLTNGLIVSEAVMMGLGPHLGRQYAHDLVYDICRKVVATGRPLVDLLAENAEITKYLDRAALEKLCDPANYLGEAGAMVDRVLAMRGKTLRLTTLRQIRDGGQLAIYSKAAVDNDHLIPRASRLRAKLPRHRYLPYTRSAASFWRRNRIIKRSASSTVCSLVAWPEAFCASAMSASSISMFVRISVTPPPPLSPPPARARISAAPDDRPCPSRAAAACRAR